MSGLPNEEWRTSADWLRYRVYWLRTHPPHSNGCYLCGICGHWVMADEVTLDHIEPRTLENMFADSNIQPAHGRCNYLKGSKRWEPKVDKEIYNLLRLVDELQENEVKNKNSKARPYKTVDGEILPILPLTGNTPRISGTRNTGDSKFLSVNDGKLSKLQHIIA